MKRWPVVRHVRWLLWKLQIERRRYAVRLAGHSNFDHLASEALDAIWRGKC